MLRKNDPHIKKFKFKLAAHLGMTVGELETRISYKELFEWQEYHRQEPFIADRLERMIAQLTALMANNKTRAFEYMISLSEDDRKNLINAKVKAQIEESLKQD